MATVKITHRWADDSETEMVVSSPGPAAGADVDRIVNGGPDADE